MKPFIVILLLGIQLNVFSQAISGFQEYTYKRVDAVELKLLVKNPVNFDESTKYPTIVFFFGGGWNSGTITQFKPHAEYLSSRGMITVLADYRVKTRHQTTPFDAVADAKSAIRFLRQNSKTLHIDNERIVASGGSAGGHLAAAAATVPGLNDPQDDLKVSAKPNALVLYNPVFDNGPTGYGYERVGERYLEISPIHNIDQYTPPTLVFLGTKDDLVPVETAKRFKKNMEVAGNRCDLFLYEDQKHGFFNYREGNKDGNRYFTETMEQTDIFLESIGYLRGKPTIRKSAQ
ncbi:alpha/beta hydrolase [uncultured Sunxiuqinia sp.]|uniref:alpha/beta hydrolase n=1 Tax=uncultured Sunxiuqinia sp. TaxID=1573825 RepID=UPI0030D76E36